jgi:hypothetical protein
MKQERALLISFYEVRITSVPKLAKQSTRKKTRDNYSP